MSKSSKLSPALIVIALLMVGCVPQPKRLGLIVPIEHRSSITQVKLGRDIAGPVIVGVPQTGELQPIASRLLVKIAASEVLRYYRPGERNDKSIRESIPSLDKLPASVRVSGALELGINPAGERLIRLKLEKPIPIEAIKQALQDTQFALEGRVALAPKSREAINIVVKTKLDVIGRVERSHKTRKFAQLKPDSHLHAVFDTVGVQSIRRVFRRVERPDGRGGIRVVKMKTLAGETKQKNPVRSARGYADLALPDNMENWFLLNLRAGADLTVALAQLIHMKGIEQAAYDYPVIMHQPEPWQEPEFDNQWGLQGESQFGIDIRDSWPKTADNETVVVAVIDTGIKADLDELQGRMWVNEGETPDDDGIDNEGNGVIDDRYGITVDDFEVLPYPVVAGTHGTHVAGIISAVSTNNNLIAGVAGKADVRLMNISLGYDRGCTELAEALDYACGNEETEVVNMSLGTAPHPMLWETVQECLTREGGGVTLIASAGNRRRRVTEDYYTTNATFPAFYPGVIAVGGSQSDGQIWVDDLDATTGSNYGIGLDLVAPAENIWTISFTAPDQTQAELKDDFSGTSASVAFVSGVAALILGKHSSVRLEKLRHWLRATAKDLEDPVGSIAAGSEPAGTYAGEDIYTGAGLLRASQAVTDDTPDPVVVDILVEKTGVLENAVIGNPDLGITVDGPIVGNWELHYAVGDWPGNPDAWILLEVPEDVSSQSLIVERNEVAPWWVDVETGHNYLDTDALDNRQVYMLRLKAADVHGNEYTAYDAFMPVRAMLTVPPEGTPVPIRWGWPELGGIVDTRPGATYSISLRDMTTNSLVTQWLWETPDDSDPNRGAKWDVLIAAERYELLGESRDYPLYPFSMRYPVYEHNLRYYLGVQSPNGRMTVDTQDIFVDATAFPLKTGAWPRSIPRSPVPGGDYYFRGVQAADMTGTGDYRLFVFKGSYFMCLSPTGTLLWQKEIFLRQAFPREDQKGYPSFVIEDLDGNGSKEIIVAGKATDPEDDIFKDTIFVLDRDGNDYPGWPRRTPCDQQTFFETFSSLRSGDVDNLPNGHKEIVFYERYPDRTVALHVKDLNGEDLPGYPRMLDQSWATLQVGDIDNDGKDEIILENGNLAYDENGEIAGWPPQGLWNASCGLGGVVFAQLDTDAPLEVVRYGISGERYIAAVVEGNGTVTPGWPRELDEVVPRVNRHGAVLYSSIYAKVKELASDGIPKLILVYDKIRVLNPDGSDASEFPVIDIGGECRGFDLIDVDGDGALEYVVLVLDYIDDQGWKDVGYYNLEAFELDGTPLSASDSRWPVRIPSGDFQAWRNSVTIEDIDGDNKLDLVRVANDHPYGLYSLMGKGCYGPRAGRIEAIELQQ